MEVQQMLNNLFPEPEKRQRLFHKKEDGLKSC